MLICPKCNQWTSSPHTHHKVNGLWYLLAALLIGLPVFFGVAGYTVDTIVGWVR